MLNCFINIFYKRDKFKERKYIDIQEQSVTNLSYIYLLLIFKIAIYIILIKYIQLKDLKSYKLQIYIKLY